MQRAYESFQEELQSAYFSAGSPVALMEGACRTFDSLRSAGVRVALNTGMHDMWQQRYGAKASQGIRACWQIGLLQSSS